MVKPPLSVDKGANWIVIDADGVRVADFLYGLEDEEMDDAEKQASLFVESFNKKNMPQSYEEAMMEFC